MKIIIAGAGEVGTHLAKMLSQENHDIVLMDSDEERLYACNGMEVLPVVGFPTSPRDLKEAGVKDADLFVSVTPNEAENMVSCVLASHIGAQKTLARINNYEYLLPKNRELFKDFGVNSMIYPERLAAKEIVSAIDRPWSRQYWELFDGAFMLIGVKVRANATHFINRKLSDLHSDEKIYHIVAIKRGHETIIPRGNDQVQMGDIVFFTTTRDYVDDVRILAGKEDPEVKKVFIMGASRIAMRVCQYLPNHLRVKVIEKDKAESHRMAELAPSNVLVINGDGRDTDLLRQEGIEDAQAFIALTEQASTNILACMTAKRLGVFKTIAQVENLDYIQMAENLDIGSVINKKLIAASHIYQMLLDADVTNVKCLTFADADVAELIARPQSKITRKKVSELRLPSDLTLGGLIRDGVPMIIEGNTQIQAGDHVVVFCLDTAFRKIEDYFN